MEPKNKHPFIVATLAHCLVVFASVYSGALLFQKFRLSEWEFQYALGAALFLGTALFVSSEAASIFFSNLVGLFFQEEKPFAQIKRQLLFGVCGFVVSGIILSGLAYVSIKNIVSLQALQRDHQTISLNELPKVKPLYETVKSLELAFKGANEEYQAAQERFKSYTGTNQYQNLGKANQAAVRAQNRKDRLEIELKTAREKYLLAYQSEEAKGTNRLDRADNGTDSKAHLAGMVEFGAPLVAILAMLLFTYAENYTVLYTASFNFRKAKNKISIDTEKFEKKVPQIETNYTLAALQSTSNPSLAEMLLKAYKNNLPQKDIVQRFNLEKSKVSRIMTRIDRLAQHYIANGENRFDAELHATQDLAARFEKVDADDSAVNCIDNVFLEEWIAKAASQPPQISQAQICQKFDIKPHLVSRLVRRTINGAGKNTPTHEKLCEVAKSVIGRSAGVLGSCKTPERSKISIPTRVKHTNFVYFIKAQDVNLFKIGMTKYTPEQRLVGLQTACPHRLSIFGYIICNGNAQDLETKFHETFKEQRKNGEWFELEDEQAKQAILNAKGTLL